MCWPRKIELLRRNADDFDASPIYVSHHGESLGQRSLYLHGNPYALAPPEQIHVPMVMWISRSAQLRSGIHALETVRLALRLSPTSV